MTDSAAEPRFPCLGRAGTRPGDPVCSERHGCPRWEYFQRLVAEGKARSVSVVQARPDCDLRTHNRTSEGDTDAGED